MAQLIGCLIAGYLCIYLPWKANQKEESRKRQDMYNNLNKKSVDEMDKKKNSASYKCSANGHPHILSKRVLLLSKE